MEDAQDQTDVPFEAAEALQLVSSFFDKEWPETKLEDVQLQQITGGLINRLHLLKRCNAASAEPAMVLIRHFGSSGDREQQPLNSNTTLSAAEQAIVYTEMGRRGWGPKIYGIFPGGRLEEWIDAHPLTAEESMTDCIRHDVARSYARLHSLQLPFRKDNFGRVVSELTKGFEVNADKVMELWLGLDCPQATECARLFGETNWGCELAWTSSLFDRYGCRAAFTLGDNNYLNVLVKNYESEFVVTLIDFETVTYSYRGIDIGGHFMERMYGWSRPTSKLTGHSAPSIDEQRSFCKSYLQEMQDLGQCITDKDTVDQLMLEGHIGSMHQLIWVVLMCLVMDEIEEDPFFLDSLSHMMKTYFQLKYEFLQAQ